MQPTCKHVPPRKGSFSMTIVFSPSSPARIAAIYPPGPLPIIATSYLATRTLLHAARNLYCRLYFVPLESVPLETRLLLEFVSRYRFDGNRPSRDSLRTRASKVPPLPWTCLDP